MPPSFLLCDKTAHRRYGPASNYQSPYDVPQHVGGVAPRNNNKKKKKRGGGGKSILEQGLDMFDS